MKKILLALLAFAIVMPAVAEIVIEKHDGSVVMPDNASINKASSSSYTIGGIPVDQIKKIYNNALQQPNEEDPLDLGNDIVKPVAVLDMNARNKITENSEDGRYLYSAEYMAQIAGLPYFVTTSIDDCIANSSMILFAGCIGKNTFADAEYAQLIQWVEKGGVIISPAVEFNAPGKCFELLGVESVNPKQKTHTIIKWSEEDLDELAYIDCDEELNTYIGPNYIFTATYVPSNAQVLATYDDTDDAAVIKHHLGLGCVYSVGVRWRDVIQRCQLNKSGKNRTKNNHFEASADIYPLFLRACYVANAPVAVWKHTIPDGYQTVLIPTHDCDSRTAYEEMHWIAEYEHSIGLNAHFFITTHYFRQPQYLSAFYNEETKPAVQALLDQGHTVGSHSICHFPDFSNTERFPMTETTPEEYAATCTFDVENKVAAGGSTWAEVVMSKQIIENDFGNNVRSFRSGHLCMNNNIPFALSTGGYSFASTYTATDLWGAFPFFQRFDLKWTGDQSGVLQMPLHYSDVKPTGETMTDAEIEGTMPVWMDCHLKLKANFAPNILLIHPNKEWKMEAEKQFIELLDPETVGLCNFEDYGDFWIKRLQLDYKYACSDSQVKIIVNAEDLEPYKGQGLFVETSDPITSIAIADRNGRLRPVRIVKISDRRYIAVL